jgi:hypothetical protein
MRRQSHPHYSLCAKAHLPRNPHATGVAEPRRNGLHARLRATAKSVATLQIMLVVVEDTQFVSIIARQNDIGHAIYQLNLETPASVSIARNHHPSAKDFFRAASHRVFLKLRSLHLGHRR